MPKNGGVLDGKDRPEKRTAGRRNPVRLARAEPLVELRLFGSLPFVMAMVVMFLTIMAFRGSEPLLSVLMQRLLGFKPVLVAWVQMLPNLVYGAMVILVGRLADRVPCHVLVAESLSEKVMLWLRDASPSGGSWRS
jgi:predicted MFS family arabinose efflux permease